MANSLTFTMGLDRASLQKFIQSASSKVEDAVRPAAQAGAQVIYDQAKRNVQAIGKKTGNLERSIYQAFSPEKSKLLTAVYHVSWNQKTAPHGRLVEYGHIQRYVSYVGSDGNWYTAKRKGVKGKKPSRKASQAVKDAYYMTLKTPKLIPAKPFMRNAIVSHGKKALDAMAAEFAKRVGYVG